ncbi:MAG: hypothetical protein GX564_00220 [Oligosphaeraceae bacterium]|nr:hypothetical protein [Oligosphaeraceae bacterium]
MSNLSWLFLNALLIVAAILSTVTMRKIAIPELPRIEAAEKTGKDSKGGKNDPQQQVSRLAPKTTALNFEEIWEKSLFRPDRTEKTDTGAESTGSEQAPEKSDFELTGIAWMGLPGQAKPVAVIKQRQSLPQRNTTRRIIRGRRVPLPGTPAPAENEPEKPQNVVFAVGDAINDSGYILAEINTEENSAVLKRNAERVELKIEFGSDASLQRKTAAVNEASARQKQREAAETQSAASKLATPVPAKTAPGGADMQPPGPPGAPGAAPTPVRPGVRSPQVQAQPAAPDAAAASPGSSASQREKLRQRLELLNRSTRRPPPRQ